LEVSSPTATDAPTAIDSETGSAATPQRAEPIPASRYAERLDRVRAALPDPGAQALLLGVGPDLRWLTGYAPGESERLTLLVVTPDATPRLVVPRLELTPAREAPASEAGLVEPISWEDTQDPFEIVRDIVAAPRDPEHPSATGPGTPTVSMLVSDHLRAAFLLRLQSLWPGVSWGVSSSVMQRLRAVKDGDEIRLLRAAAEGADRVIEAIAAGRLVGRTEADVAHEIGERLVAEGHDAALFATVGSGPNSASPHHEPGERVIQPGEPIVLDIGGTLQGYTSDITRTLWVKGPNGSGPDRQFARLFEAVESAQEAATAAVRPGLPCEAIDEVARSSIGAAGFGEQFIHRTGHGIGLEIHEHPYLVAGNAEPLREGNAFSVEPGIYFEGRYGARIEDIVVCGHSGPAVLNAAPRELYVVEGV
jgi:Xaa-Pro aminopeptidase